MQAGSGEREMREIRRSISFKMRHRRRVAQSFWTQEQESSRLWGETAGHAGESVCL